MQLGKYQLVAEIARGGMGIVYLAVSRGPARFSKLVVIKELKPELVDDPGFLDMFLEEARLAARLSHPNIVQTHEVGNDDHRHYMVMDYLEGTTLARIVRKRLPGFTTAMHLRILCEVLRGLHYAHTLSDFDGSPLGIVHRDATPHNVFVTYDGQVKLVDFGIAKAIDSTIETNTGVFKGKPSYTAPEQIRGESDARADIYTVGVMLWEALAGRRMWHKHTDVEVLTRILEGRVPSLRDEVADAPEELVALTEHALSVDVGKRLDNALDFAAAIEQYLATEHPGVSMREVGRIVSEGYAAERAGVRAIIDTHLMGLELGTERLKLPTLRTVGPMSESNAEAATPTHDTSGNSSFPSAVAANVPPTQDRTEVMPFAPPKVPVIVPPAGFDENGDPAPSTGRTKLASVIAGASIVAVFALVLVLVRGRSTTPPSPPSPTPPAITAATGEASSSPPMTPARVEAPPVSLAPSSHAVAVRVFPVQATITIDGTEVKNPVTQSCTHGRSLSVHASLVGHLSADRTLACEQDESIEIALASNVPTVRPAAPPRPPPAPPKPIAAVHPRPTPAPPPPAPPLTKKPSTEKPSTEVSPAGGSKPLRPIETASPYGK